MRTRVVAATYLTPLGPRARARARPFSFMNRARARMVITLRKIVAICNKDGSPGLAIAHFSRNCNYRGFLFHKSGKIFKYRHMLEQSFSLIMRDLVD